MKVLFTVFAAKTHYFNLVPIASALKAAGHDVLVAVQPDLVDTVSTSGHAAVVVGSRLNLEEETQQATDGLQNDRNLGGLAMSNPSDGPYTWEYGLAMWTAMTAFVFQNVCPEEMIDELVDTARRWKPDLVIWDPLTMAGAIAANSIGVAHARLLFGPDQMGTNRTRFRAAAERIDRASREDPIEDWVAWSYRRNNISADPTADNLVLGDWTIDPTPTPFCSYTHPIHIPVQHIPYNGRSVLPQWALQPASDRRVVVTLGASLGEVPDGGKHLGGVLAEAVSAVDAEVLMTLPRSLVEHVGPLPRHVRTEEFIPLAPILRTSDVVVHHGGSGTFLSSLREGVPQVLVTDGMWDAYDKARGIVATGAGTVIDPNRATTDAIRTAIEDALRGVFTPGSQSLQSQVLAMPTPTEIVRPLVDLTQSFNKRKGTR